jgi:hypothetical protein
MRAVVRARVREASSTAAGRRAVIELLADHAIQLNKKALEELKDR